MGALRLRFRLPAPGFRSLIGDQVSSVEILRNVALFDQLAAADLELVAGMARRLKFPKGSIVFQEGDPVTGGRSLNCTVGSYALSRSLMSCSASSR